ncbi:MAG TPA: cell division protein ZapD [Gammaproteobacteria bacterium]|jgi:cell division protein ZapD
MIDPAEAILPEPSAEPIEFEQPLNERMRTFLRLELLYRQAVFHAGDSTDFGARAAVGSLLEILTIVGRGDVRGDVLKELDRHSELLAQYRQARGVDAGRLDSLMENLDAMRAELNSAGKQLLAELRDNEFLNKIRQRGLPGGTCAFDLPHYGYWLHRPERERATQLAKWLSQLKPLCDAVTRVLWLTRESTEPVECVATGGLYQHSLGKSEQVNLIRVLLPANADLFPEISAGPHRFTVRFAQWRGATEYPRQVAEDVRFLLALC